jgi:hypothetical protein
MTENEIETAKKIQTLLEEINKHPELPFMEISRKLWGSGSAHTRMGYVALKDQMIKEELITGTDPPRNSYVRLAALGLKILNGYGYLKHVQRKDSAFVQQEEQIKWAIEESKYAVKQSKQEILKNRAFIFFFVVFALYFLADNILPFFGYEIPKPAKIFMDKAKDEIK